MQAWTSKRPPGYDAYYGITGNGESLKKFRFLVHRTWRRWLSRHVLGTPPEKGALRLSYFHLARTAAKTGNNVLGVRLVKINEEIPGKNTIEVGRVEALFKLPRVCRGSLRDDEFRLRSSHPLFPCFLPTSGPAKRIIL